MILCHPLGKGFWKVVKQEYYDSLSSSIVLFLKCSLKMFWQGVMIQCPSSWERFLRGCKTGSLCCARAPLIPDKTKQTRNESHNEKSVKLKKLS
jgi:hypothetical protein